MSPHRIAAALLFAPTLAIAALPFAQGDAKQGEKLEAQHCTACHVKLVGGDGSEIYTRLNRMIHTPQALHQRVQACSAQTDAGLLPEEEAHVSAFLNQRYYKFK